jgi:hypothetical protein
VEADGRSPGPDLIPRASSGELSREIESESSSSPRVVSSVRPRLLGWVASSGILAFS